jgi:hypothetical protein
MAEVAAELHPDVAHAAGFLVLPVLTDNRLDSRHHLKLKRGTQSGERTLLLAKE